ncbi:hypothetical protein ACHAWF_013132, partial [Thalassiosira exigua]
EARRTRTRTRTRPDQRRHKSKTRRPTPTPTPPTPTTTDGQTTTMAADRSYGAVSGTSSGGLSLHEAPTKGEAEAGGGGSGKGESDPLLLSTAPSPSAPASSDSYSFRALLSFRLLSLRTHFARVLSPLWTALARALTPPWTALTFAWMSPLLSTGSLRGQLDPTDLHSHPLPDDCETERVYSEFERCWREELELAERSKRGGTKGENGKKKKEGGDEKEGGEGGANDDADDVEEPSPFDDLPSPADLQSAYQPSLTRALRRAFGYDFLVRAGLLKLIHDGCLFVGPQVLNGLIRFLRDGEAPLSEGLRLTVVVTVSQVVMSVCLRHYFYKCYTCGLRLRTSVVVAVYRKSLVLSLKERRTRGGPGEIANLVGIDAQRIQELVTYLHAVWYSFFQIGLAMYFLWGQVGSSCLAGVVVIVVLIPFTRYVAAWLGRIQKVLMKARDGRVALNNEVLGAMRIVKIQAWEEDFRSKLLSLRNSELDKLTQYFVANAFSVTMYGSAPLLVALATFAAYTLGGNDLDVAEALTALALFDVLRFPLFMLPQIINRIVEAGISFERVREFLLSEECDVVGEGSLEERGEVSVRNGTFVYNSKKPRLEDEDGDERKKGGIGGLMQQHRRLIQEAALDRQWEMVLMNAQLKDAEDRIHVLERELRAGGTTELEDDVGVPRHGGKWSPSSLLSLRRVTMRCKPGEFVAVVGGVCAGKSTLINSILGEGRPLTGSELAVKGKLGAFLQTPFIMNDTVRNNVLFGHAPLQDKETTKSSPDGPVDEDRYRLALDVCCLTHDLRLLPHGDATEIGEKGITLSGGQKARVALARAVYHDADVYLLDDPLAAVDAHVGKALFNKCIVDELLLGKSKPGRGSGEEPKVAEGSSWSERLLGKKSSAADGSNPSEAGARNATVILVTNALQHLSHPMVDKILVLGDGCVEEAGTFQELSSDPNSRFSAFLKTMAETSRAAVDPVSDTDATSVEEGVEGGDDLSEDALDYGGDEPEVTKVIHEKPRRSSSKRNSIVKRHSSLGAADDAAEEEGDGSGGALMTDEFKERVKGSVDREVYVSWAKAGGGVGLGVLILAMFVGVEGLNVTSKWWLTYWSQSGGAHAFFYLGIYALVNFSAIFATFCRLLLFIFAGLRASRKMFEELLDVILRAPMSFFDTTPIGRIINRFSKDLYTVDEQLVVTARSYLSTMISVFSTIFVVTAVTPMFLVGLVPIIIFYLHQQHFFAITYRELKRLDSVTRSPIYALLGETLDGVLTIRAFGAQGSCSTTVIPSTYSLLGLTRITFIFSQSP